METGAKLASDLPAWHLAVPPTSSLQSSSQPRTREQEADSGQASQPASSISTIPSSLLLSTADPARMRSLLLAFAVLLSWSDAKRHGGHHHHHHHHQNCFRPEEVQEGDIPTQFLRRSAHLNGHTALQLVPYLVEKEKAAGGRQRRHPENRCPSLKSQSILSGDVNERSISPWTYRLDEDKDRYPQQLNFAECLCKGCINIKTGGETTSLNSVPVFQSMLVLQRKPCQHSSEAAGFTFEVKQIEVPVACTCVLPRSSS